MGLDGVELIIRFEETFDIRIPDEVAGNFQTPRDVIDYVCSQVPMADKPSCLTQQSFYFLRRNFLSTLPINRTDIRPNASLDMLLPDNERKRSWKDLETRIGASLPMKKGFFRQRYRTVGELATYVALNQTRLFNGKWRRKEVARVVRDITIEEIGIKKEIYTEDSRFIDDLGVS